MVTPWVGYEDLKRCKSWAAKVAEDRHIVKKLGVELNSILFNWHFVIQKAATSVRFWT